MLDDEEMREADGPRLDLLERVPEAVGDVVSSQGRIGSISYSRPNFMTPTLPAAILGVVQRLDRSAGRRAREQDAATPAVIGERVPGESRRSPTE